VEVSKYPFNTVVHLLMGFQCAPSPCSVAAIALCKSKYWILGILLLLILALDSFVLIISIIFFLLLILALDPSVLTQYASGQNVIQ
jgi:hypothetical protein